MFKGGGGEYGWNGWGVIDSIIRLFDCFSDSGGW